MADAVEPVRKHMDEKAPDELGSGQPHGLLFVPILNPVVFPLERDGVGIGTDQTAV